MKLIVDRIDGLEVPLIFDDQEIKMIEFGKEERKDETPLPIGFPKNYPGQTSSYVTKPIYTITMSFKDGEQKKLIFEMADRQLWVQALNKLSGIDFTKLKRSDI